MYLFTCLAAVPASVRDPKSVSVRVFFLGGRWVVCLLNLPLLIEKHLSPSLPITKDLNATDAGNNIRAVVSQGTTAVSSAGAMVGGMGGGSGAGGGDAASAALIKELKGKISTLEAENARLRSAADESLSLQKQVRVWPCGYSVGVLSIACKSDCCIQRESTTAWRCREGEAVCCPVRLCVCREQPSDKAMCSLRSRICRLRGIASSVRLLRWAERCHQASLEETVPYTVGGFRWRKETMTSKNPLERRDEHLLCCILRPTKYANRSDRRIDAHAFEYTQDDMLNVGLFVQRIRRVRLYPCPDHTNGMLANPCAQNML